MAPIDDLEPELVEEEEDEDLGVAPVEDIDEDVVDEEDEDVTVPEKDPPIKVPLKDEEEEESAPEDISDDVGGQITETITIDDAKKVDEPLNCNYNNWDGFILESCYDFDKEELEFVAKLPKDTWFAIGFGNTMSDTDMIVWFADPNLSEATVRDYHSISRKQPDVDEF